MAIHKVITTDSEIDRAIARASGLADELRVEKVEYQSDPGLDLIVLHLNGGRRLIIPREDLQGLAEATPEQIAEIEILGNGTGLHWPLLGVDHYVPGLLRNIYGTRQWMASIGRSGGTAKSPAKRKASQANGRKGGRPRQTKLVASA